MKYRKNTYFNEADTFVFEGLNGEFDSKVHFEKGYWWTNEPPNYKCISVMCKRKVP